MSWFDREAFPMSGSAREASQMSGSGRETLPDVREWSRGLPVYPVVVGRPSRCPGVLVRSPGCSGAVGRPSRISESGREARPNVRERLEGLPNVREW